MLVHMCCQGVKAADFCGAWGVGEGPLPRFSIHLALEGTLLSILNHHDTSAWLSKRENYFPLGKKLIIIQKGGYGQSGTLFPRQ